MRFHSDGPAIPDILLQRCDEGRVVFLCGAGVSFPSGMPTFVDLTKHVIKNFAPPSNSEVMKAFGPWRRTKKQTGANVPLDQIFNLLYLEYGKDAVNALVTERLSAKRKNKDFAHAHGLIKRISKSADGVPQIVTTNFDRLFEVEPEGVNLAVHVPPAFPELKFGSQIEGITYLHGRLVDAGSATPSYVLSSGDFGRAYLSEGWATNFMRQLLERYTVVLVGYQAEDPPVKYLLQGLSHDSNNDPSQLFAFDRGGPGEVASKWRDRGVTAIAYAEHSDLWKTMEAWAQRADDSRGWRSAIIAKCQHNPKDLLPHERGQAAHVLRTVQGAKLFSAAHRFTHPEWICVMDADVRSATPNDGDYKFVPREAYGLDDDIRHSSDAPPNQDNLNDNLLVRRDSDTKSAQGDRLGWATWDLPKRLCHLASWMGKSVDSPVLAWWAARQRNLHPLMFEQLEREVKQSKTLHGRARDIWKLILEYHRTPRSTHRLGEWQGLIRQITTEGWTASVKRDFVNAMKPQFEMAAPLGISRIQPPSSSWSEIKLFELGLFKVSILEQRGQELSVPDNQLDQVLGMLEAHLITASGMLGDIQPAYFETPTCYPERETDGKSRGETFTGILTWFVRLFDRIDAQRPELAHAHAMIWPAEDRFIFRKLKLYALSKKNSFTADQVAREICAFNQDSFWDSKVARELLFMLADRWKEFSQEIRDKLIDRILAGPDEPVKVSVNEYPKMKIVLAAKYARYLQLQGCQFSADRSEHLAELIRSIPEWNDSGIHSMLVKRGARSGWFGTDDRSDALKDVPINDIVSKVLELHKREFGSMTEKRPFTGLVKENPRKALAALVSAGRKGTYPTALWCALIEELPSDISPRFRRLFLNRIAKLPYSITTTLAQTLGYWLKGNLVDILVLEMALGWAVYDHLIDSLLSAQKDAIKATAGDGAPIDEDVHSFNRTLDRRAAGPVGDCVVALFNLVSEAPLEKHSQIPNEIKIRVDRLLSAGGEASDDAALEAGYRLNWLMAIDPEWALSRIVPMLAFDHPSSRPAWNGLLSSETPPDPVLAEKIKPKLLNLFSWIDQCSWGNELSDVAASWLGHGRLFRKRGAGGIGSVELRSALRTMSDTTRNKFIGWLGAVGTDTTGSWVENVIPLINRDWPSEQQYKTPMSVQAWLSLLQETGEAFPDVFEAIKKFLVPIETDELLYWLTQSSDVENSLAERFPETALDLMNVMTPSILTRTPYELATLLIVISSVKPSFLSDPRYIRLIELVERN
ncbi:hypothetical protein ASF04_25530 [Duganella sp. Leaf61]|uniref:SIR2 family protein n=1 Tax=Duganella sp. Leaf61 TaxID=1736227 RepID=UPI0006F6955F|nr:SIR2 family protein [Duganella sp. Leaf61]KQN76361.1 hypothetical protein ASF04_25530 [Duganella sp. Leaf61]